MLQTYQYSYVNNVLSRVPYLAAEEIDVVRILNAAHGQGLDETSEMVTSVHNSFIGFDPKDRIIRKWDEGTDFEKPALETEYPWLATYRGDVYAPVPPVNDVAGRQTFVADQIYLWKRRLFVGNRAKEVQNIRVLVDGMEFDGDETAQTRMTRAVTIAQSQMMDQLITYLDMHRDNTTMTANELAVGMCDVLMATRNALSTTWALADNTAAIVTPTELSQALLESMTTMGALWIPPEE